MAGHTKVGELLGGALEVLDGVWDAAKVGGGDVELETFGPVRDWVGKVLAFECKFGGVDHVIRAKDGLDGLSVFRICAARCRIEVGDCEEGIDVDILDPNFEEVVPRWEGVIDLVMIRKRGGRGADSRCCYGGCDSTGACSRECLDTYGPGGQGD